MFKAVLIEKDDRGYRAKLTELPEDRLPEGDVTVDGKTLSGGDAAAVSGGTELELIGAKPAQVLLFDLN